MSITAWIVVGLVVWFAALACVIGLCIAAGRADQASNASTLLTGRGCDE